MSAPVPRVVLVVVLLAALLSGCGTVRYDILAKGDAAAAVEQSTQP